MKSMVLLSCGKEGFGWLGENRSLQRLRSWKAIYNGPAVKTKKEEIYREQLLNINKQME